MMREKTVLLTGFRPSVTGQAKETASLARRDLPLVLRFNGKSYLLDEVDGTLKMESQG